MKGWWLNQAVVLLAVLGLCQVTAVAQQQAANPADEGQVRKELEAVFRERNEALKTGDKAKVNGWLAPDFVVKLPGGKTLTRQEMEELMGRDIGQSNYLEEFVIEKLEVKGATAVAEVRHQESYHQRFKDGTEGDVVSSLKRRETWVKTAAGWRLKLVDKLSFGKATLDGKPVDAKRIGKISNLPLHEDQPRPAGPEDKSILQVGKAIALIYRLKDSAGLLKPPVYLNDQEIAKVRQGRYLKLKLEPGVYRLRSEKGDELSVTVEGGRVYYFEVKLERGFPKAHGKLVLDDGPLGSQIYLVPHTLSMQPLGEADIKDSSRVIK